jgi:hypothetical protein
MNSPLLASAEYFSQRFIYDGHGMVDFGFGDNRAGRRFVISPIPIMRLKPQISCMPG